MAPQETKPRVFIGSSSDGLEMARYLQSALQRYVEPTVWDQDLFDLSESTLGNLVRIGKNFDLAVLVLTPADIVTKKGRTLPAARDNVIFEIGLFMGSMGPHRTFVVYSEDDNLELPSDLAGVTIATYMRRTDGDLRAAMEPLALRIRDTVIRRAKEGITRVQVSASPGPFDEAVFNWMNLSEAARKKLGESEFIKIGRTGEALMNLIASAERDHSMLAICGYKGSYSTRYYEENFERCKAVIRVFSYESIRDEIKTKKESHALAGLKMHLDYKHADGRVVDVFFIPEGKWIRDLGSRDFDPPSSFGLAILRDKNDLPKKAIIHWETDAERLKHLIAIEGVIIDSGQEELLNKLVELHESIARSDGVLSSKKHREEIERLYAELEDWKSQYLIRKRGKR